jgi:hypothetical protein
MSRHLTRAGVALRPTTLEFTAEKFGRWREHARQRRMSITAWIENACESQLNRETRYRSSTSKRREETRTVHASGWPVAWVCPACKRLHDPLDGSHGSAQLSRTELMGEWFPAYTAAGGRFPDDG